MATGAIASANAPSKPIDRVRIFLFLLLFEDIIVPVDGTAIAMPPIDSGRKPSLAMKGEAGREKFPRPGMKVILAERAIRSKGTYMLRRADEKKRRRGRKAVGPTPDLPPHEVGDALERSSVPARHRKSRARSAAAQAGRSAFPSDPQTGWRPSSSRSPPHDP
jgi:hypothetical protein